MAAITQITIDPAQGPVTLMLQAERALPMQGVLSCRDVGHIDPLSGGDPSVVEWQLPPTTALYVTYGIVLPLKSVWFAPAYTRQFFQGGQLLNSGAASPRRFKTEQQADGEWVGPPDAFRIVAGGS
jgi:hypothetical protein